MNTNPLESMASEMFKTIGAEASLELLEQLREVLTSKNTDDVGEGVQYGDRTKEAKAKTTPL